MSQELGKASLQCPAGGQRCHAKAFSRFNFRWQMVTLFSFSAYFYLPFSFNSTSFYLGLMVFECLARFATLSTAVLAKEKYFAEVAG